MTPPTPTQTTHTYQHLPTTLRSPSHPILLRTLQPADAPALAALLSDPRNTALDGGPNTPPPQPMSTATAESVIQRMRESAAQPTIVDGRSGRVRRGPGRVNLVVVYLGPSARDGDGDGEREVEGDDGEAAKGEGRVIGLGGFGGIKDLDAAGNTVSTPELPDGEEFLRVGDVGAMIDPAYRGRGFGAEAVRLAMEWGFRRAEAGGLQLDKITATTLAVNGPMVAVFERKMGWTGTRKGEEVEFAMTVGEWEARK
ncbi:hypothetical protein F5B20DRAFT_165946 [Whalleya microplaca]|nr:hypothetical protein F5B20DRAFT_165946 [Whalleya microplaca]